MPDTEMDAVRDGVGRPSEGALYAALAYADRHIKGSDSLADQIALEAARYAVQKLILAAPSAAGGREIRGGEGFLLSRLDEQVGDALREKIGDAWAYGPEGTIDLRLGVEEARRILLAAAPSQGSDTGEAGREPKGSGHSRAGPSGLGAAPECPSRGPLNWTLSEGARAHIRDIELVTVRPGDPRLSQALIGPAGPAAGMDGYGSQARPLVPASCDGSGEAGETAGLDPKGNSAVGAAETPSSPTAPQGADLAGLSAAATQGELSAPDWGTDFRAGKVPVGMTSPTGDGNGKADRAFIVALWNAYRSGALAPTTSAPPASAKDQDLIRRACLLHGKWLSEFTEDGFMGPEVQRADATLLLDLAIRADRLSRSAVPPASADRKTITLTYEGVVGRMRAAFPDLTNGEAQCAAEGAFPECLRDEGFSLALAHPGSVAPTSGDQTPWSCDMAAVPAGEEVEVGAGRMTFLAKLVPNGSLTLGGKPCDQWQATREGEHPPCWSDGCCWASNEDEDASLLPDRWRRVAPAFRNEGERP